MTELLWLATLTAVVTLASLVVLRSALVHQGSRARLVLVACIPALTATWCLLLLNPHALEVADLLERLAPVWLALRLAVRGIVARSRPPARH